MKHMLRILWLLALLTPWIARGQSITGTVQEQTNNEPVIGALVRIQGTSIAVPTNFQGQYTIKLSSEGTVVLEVTMLGFETETRSVTVGKDQTVTVNISLRTSVSTLNEIVVVGYGVSEKKDLTGSVASVNAKDFNQGNLNTPEQLVMGKVPGLQITPNAGAPGSGSVIRIRGGSSLNASNDPLIVIDGVPVSNDGIGGIANPLSLINPNDIENITVLKDASATAIYGSRASNGVLIITTKKGKGTPKFHVEFNTVNSVSTVARYADVFTADELRNYIKENSPGDTSQLGTANTNWQREIYHRAISSDNIITFSGGLKKLPYRLSLGYLNQNGLLRRGTPDLPEMTPDTINSFRSPKSRFFKSPKQDNLQRGSVNLNLSPSFFKDHLKIDLNQKSSLSNSFFANQGAIGSAVAFDPTQPVLQDGSKYGGYFEWTAGAVPNALSPRNPVGQIEQQEDKSEVIRHIGNLQADYKLHFLPELRANVNVGYDISNSRGTVQVADSAAANYGLLNQGLQRKYEQSRTNKVFDFYLNYKKSFNAIKSIVDFTAGYSYQDWYYESPNFRELDGDGDTIVGSQTPAFPFVKSQNTLISGYGRLNLTFDKRYLVTLTLRNDGSSRFAKDYRWGLFPSAAFAWRIVDEKWLKRFSNLSDMKLRIGYGTTGQQDVGVNFNYLPLYTQGEMTAAYQFGDSYYYTLRPNVYDPKFQWESTTTYNAGLDFGFYNGRITGVVDVYYKHTYDLIAEINIPAGINFGTRVLTNVGEIENRGIEIGITTFPYARENFELEVGMNFTANRNKVLTLDRFPNPNDLGAETGNIDGNVGSFIQINSVGYPIQTFFVYEQKYHENGKPIEPNAPKPDGSGTYTELDAYVDRNGDGVINNSDRYRYQNPAPQFYMALNLGVRYKKWFARALIRGSFGNYVYNNFASNTGTLESIATPQGNINNGSTSALESGFRSRQLQSDYYVENASFIRGDNFNLGYDFGKIFKGKAGLRVYAAIQNAFIISSYSGIDPEVFGGIDRSIYPRPRIFSIGANIQL